MQAQEFPDSGVGIRRGLLVVSQPTPQDRPGFARNVEIMMGARVDDQTHQVRAFGDRSQPPAELL